MRLFMFALLATALSGADFNGRWIFTVQGDPRGRVWWLKVEGAGTPAMRGEFIGAPGGDLDVITRMSIEGGELHWSVRDNHYRAKLEGEIGRAHV